MFTEFDKLITIINQLGAPPVVANLEKLLHGKGIPVEQHSDRIIVGENGIFYIDPTGVLTKVVIHIVDKDINSRYSKELKQFVHNKNFTSPELIKGIHKYHLINCATIKRAEEEGWKKEKYRMSRKQNGSFYYRFLEDNKVISEQTDQKLTVCKNCLNEINKKLNENFTTTNFNIAEFLSTDIIMNDSLPKDSTYSDMSIPNIYQQDWNDISKKYREQTGYQCENEGCPSPDLSEKKYHRYLHTHHISHDKSNSAYSNLKAMCIHCHANQANHEQIKNTPDYIKYKTLKSIHSTLLK